MSFLCSGEAFSNQISAKTNIPKFFYLTLDRPQYEGKNYLRVKSDDFHILAKRDKTEDGKIYWRTVKIQIKNEVALASWPYEIRDLITRIRQKSKPREPLFDVTLFANPFSFATVNSQRTINTGYRMNTKSAISEKHQFSHDTTINHDESRSDLDQSKQEMISYTSNLLYDFNRFWGNWTYFAILGYRREKVNGIYNLKDQVRLGILGLKYLFIKDGKIIKKMDLSYIPLYEWVSSDNDIQPPGEPPSKTINTIRHSLRYRALLEWETWSIDYSLTYTPAYQVQTKILDMQDIDLRSMLTVKRPLTEKLSFTYSNNYTYDIRRIRSGNPGTRRDNAINTFALDWTLEI